MSYSTPGAVLYARYSPRPQSRDDQGRLRECDSHAMQFARMRAYCAATDLPVLAEYDDQGISGTTDQRPGFRAAIAHAAKAKAAFVVTELSRFSRDLGDTIHYSKLLGRAGAHLISLQERIDTTSPIGAFYFELMAALNKLEARRTSERTSAAVRQRIREGRFHSGRAPLGYLYQGEGSRRVIEPNPAEQLALEMMLRWKAEGAKIPQIARRLVEGGYYSRSGSWTPVRVKNAIRRLKRRQAMYGCNPHSVVDQRCADPDVNHSPSPQANAEPPARGD